MVRVNVILDIISTQSRVFKKFIRLTLEKYERIVTDHIVQFYVKNFATSLAVFYWK